MEPWFFRLPMNDFFCFATFFIFFVYLRDFYRIVNAFVAKKLK